MVKPTKMRNRMLFQATLQTRSKQMGSALSKDLQKKYGKKSARVVEGDSVTILRGEFKGVDGKISKISTQKSSVAIDGVKKEKTKGDKFDVYIHTSNLVINSLNSDDKWRMAKLEGKDPRKQPKETTTKEKKTEPKVEKEVEKKEIEK
jgi:large subunit ribosomal protein L24